MAHPGGMDSDGSNGDGGERFIRAISLVCALGAVWLSVAVVYAAWVRMVG